METNLYKLTLIISKFGNIECVTCLNYVTLKALLVIDVL